MNDVANDTKELIDTLRRTFRSGRTRSVAWRRDQLRQVSRMLREREAVFLDAMREDMGKPSFEAWIGDLALVSAEIDYTVKHLEKWVRPQKVKTPLANMPGRSWVQREPLGVALIIGAWNYPFLLVLAPLVGAIAAGNCAVLKPSEIAPASAAALAEWLPRYVDHDAIRIFAGGIDETKELLDHHWDKIFYTGGGRVGRIVMEAAAKHLTPVTLELGGKSPAIVDRDVDLEVAARRIVQGKFFNAGQTCVASDHVLVDRAVLGAFLDRVKATIRDFYGPDPKKSPDYARIINARHFARLRALLAEGEIVTGGETDESELYIAPTVMRDPPPDGRAMTDEIFGPILPVVAVRDIDDAIDHVNARPKPLALYVFSRDREVQRRVLELTTSGGACVNEVLAHATVPELPFGGVGHSGMGAYHGRFGFETFSHRKAVLEKGTLVDPLLRYPPYDASKMKWAKRLL